MIIFFAHSVYDYGTEKERSWLDNIIMCYPNDEIISSDTINNKISDYDRDKGFRYIEEKYFFPIIDDSDIVIITPSWNMNRFTIGVVSEMMYAHSKSKKLRMIENEIIRDMDISDIRICEDTVAFHIPGEEPVKMRELIIGKGFVFNNIE